MLASADYGRINLIEGAFCNHDVRGIAEDPSTRDKVFTATRGEGGRVG